MLVSAMYRAKDKTTSNEESMKKENNVNDSDRQSITRTYRKADTFVKATQFKDIEKGQLI